MRRPTRFDALGGFLTAGLVGLSLVACAPMPVTTAQRPIGLGFRLVVETGSAVVAGVVTAPAALLDERASVLVNQAVPELPVPGATLIALDRAGQPLAQVAPVQTDERGRFQVRGWRIGEPGFLQVRFTDAQGRARELKAYVRPESDQACGTVSLTTTLLAARVTELGDQVPLFSADKLSEVAATTRAQLPGLLEAAARDGTLGGPQAGLGQLLDDLTLAPTTPAQAAQQARATAGLTKVFSQVPVLAQGLEQAVETFLDVGFTVQAALAIAENQAPAIREDRIRHLLVGRAELMCRDAAGELTAVSFWLNNEQVAAGTYAAGAWSVELDSRRLADGPYVLSAIGTPKEAGRAPVMARAFLYVRNTRPTGAFPCAEVETEARS